MLCNDNLIVIPLPVNPLRNARASFLETGEKWRPNRAPASRARWRENQPKSRAVAISDSKQAALLRHCDLLSAYGR